MSRRVTIAREALRSFKFEQTPTETPVGVVENATWVVGFKGDEFILFQGSEQYGSPEQDDMTVEAINRETGECVELLFEGGCMPYPGVMFNI